MFDVLSVPRASNSSYFGIPTEKTHATEYRIVNPNSHHDTSYGFQENTNKLIPLNGKPQNTLTGVWELTDVAGEGIKITIVVRENELLEVLDKNGLVWRAEVSIPKKMHEEALRTSGCYEKVALQRERARDEARDAFWS